MKNMHLKHLLSLLILSATSTQAALILYTGEEGITDPVATTATDQLTSDGSQNGTFFNSTVVNTDAKFGTNAYGFDGSFPSYDRIAFGIANQSLGSAFTLAAFVKQSDNTLTRLFSNYSGSGGVSTLLFDMENNFNSGLLGANEMRFIINGTTIYGNVASDPTYGNEYYHYAVTYNDGEVNLYFNGDNVGSGTAGSGAFTLAGDLFFGEDIGGTGDENMNGSADDILIYNEAMTPAQIADLAANGAVATIPEPSSLLLMTAGVLSALGLTFLRRKC